MIHFYLFSYFRNLQQPAERKIVGKPKGPLLIRRELGAQGPILIRKGINKYQSVCRV